MAAVGISLSSDYSAEYLFFGFTPLINEFISLGAVRTVSWNESLHLKHYIFLKNILNPCEYFLEAMGAILDLFMTWGP